MRQRSLLTPWLAAGLALLAAPESLLACAICYGEPGHPVTEGMSAAVWTLLGFVALVQIGFVRLFWNFRQRAKRLAEKNPQLRLIQGGKA